MHRRRREISWARILSIIIGAIAALAIAAVIAFAVMLIRIDEKHDREMEALGLRSDRPSDQDMISHFNSHRLILQRLVDEVKHIPKYVEITRTYVNDNPPHGLIDPVRDLLWEAGVFGVTVSHGEVSISYAADGWLDNGWYKDFIWLPQEPVQARIVYSLDDFAENFDGDIGIALRHIEGNWYLRYMELH